MAGQIGFLPETFSANSPTATPNAEIGQDILGAGENFRRKLNNLNAEWSAESTLAQSPAAPATDELLKTDLASLTSSALVAQSQATDFTFAPATGELLKTDLASLTSSALVAESQATDFTFPNSDLQAASPSDIAIDKSHIAELASTAAPTQDPPLRLGSEVAETTHHLDPQRVEPSQIVVRTRPDLDGNTPAPANASDADLRTQTGGDITGSSANRNSEGAPKTSLIGAIASTEHLEKSSVSSIEPEINALAQVENPLVEKAPAKLDRTEINEEIKFRQPSPTDGDVPPASPQQRPTHQLSRVQQVPAFTPFQQNAAATLPTESTGAAAPVSVDNSITTNPTDRLVLPANENPNSIPQDASVLLSNESTLTPTALTGRQNGELRALPASSPTEIPFAPPQTGTTELASNVPVSADTPLLQQDDAAVLPEQQTNTADASAEVEVPVPRAAETASIRETKLDTVDASADVEAPAPRAAETAGVRETKLVNETVVSPTSQTVTADTAPGETKQFSALETALGTSQSTQVQTAARVQIPVIAAQLQQAGTLIPQAQVGDIPNILSDALSLEDGSKKITVQLDPPELGRVSIDFKFDGNVLQTVLVTGESPEAMRRLRLMHFELVQSLETHGFSGQELDFSQRGDDQRAQNLFYELEDGAPIFSQEDATDLARQDHPATRQKILSEGLNLKL